MGIQKMETSKLIWCLLSLILLLSLTLNIFHNDFSIFFHPDESVKLGSIDSNHYHFRHPLFMVQLIKIFKIFLSPFFSSTIEVSRTVSAFCGTAAVFFTFFLARNGLKNNYFALITALAFAVSPILVVHSHYIKESIYFTFCETFFLLQLINFTQEQNLRQALLLGFGLGLSVSSEYIGFFSLILLLVPLFFEYSIDKKHFLKMLIVVCITALGVFLLINYPLLLQPHTFLKGLTDEMHHAQTGHDIKIYAWDFYWSFHLTHSIVPGLTLLVTILALAGLLLTLINWKNISIENKILFFYVILFYLVEETSPLKPYPDFQRYMLCITPVLIYFSIMTTYRIFMYSRRSRNKLMTASASFLLLASIIYPLYVSAQLDYYLTQDTRTRAAEWMQLHQHNYFISRYVLDTSIPQLERRKLCLSVTDAVNQAKKKHVGYYVASSFAYQRYLDSLNMPHQSARMYQGGKKYVWLFKHFHYIELKPAFQSVAFSNPIIRIVNLNSPKNINKNSEPPSLNHDKD